ncbi:GNAT family N-acetyltransferase [Microbacterium suwonense]|uniref:GNAT family N-acetyltransferase n=1 Tax=Microbacterium suwonense TaxID=683047 RepID=A0ABM8FSN9_9MICO|nr:GNAT family N-acetyltransferase [Microbacterium suwonense]BDZ38451.1 GNAT family N-acetyltransferase [Microbacterium suwonense]
MSTRITETARLRSLVLPARADAASAEDLRIYADVRNRSIRDVTGRDDDEMTAESLLPILRSTPNASKQQWFIVVDGELVGVAPLSILGDGDGRSAILIVSLLRRFWGRGIGSAVLPELEAVARDAGVERLLTWVPHPTPADTDVALASPTGFGAIPRDHHARFLLRHGYRLEQVERVSTLTWSDAVMQRLRDLRSDAAQRADGYRIVQWLLPTPMEHIRGYARMKEHMSTDVPDADLAMPAETWDADRVRRHDERYIQHGSTVLVTAAQHVGTGELCAYNELSIGPDPTATSHQEDTLVLSSHRGHRLGMLVKTAGLLRWREHHSGSPAVITYNAEENRPMLDINEAIGFTPISYEGAWKKELIQADSIVG